MVKKRSKNKEVAAGMDIDKPATGEWQTGVSAMTEASEPSNLPTIDMEIGDSVPTTEQEETKKPLKMKGGNVTKVSQAKRGNRTTKQKRRKALKLAKALGHSDRKDTSNKRKLKVTARKNDLKGLWSIEKNVAHLPQD